ncbi:hypothetical protein DFH09DRAFT_1300002 [Mycena vulgaris]|nr:hypothetical protein DFH09DRAFT_1300002 [Mycena vulgaris]
MDIVDTHPAFFPPILTHLELGLAYDHAALFFTFVLSLPVLPMLESLKLEISLNDGADLSPITAYLKHAGGRLQSLEILVWSRGSSPPAVARLQQQIFAHTPMLLHLTFDVLRASDLLDVLFLLPAIPSLISITVVMGDLHGTFPCCTLDAALANPRFRTLLRFSLKDRWNQIHLSSTTFCSPLHGYDGGFSFHPPITQALPDIPPEIWVNILDLVELHDLQAAMQASSGLRCLAFPSTTVPALSSFYASFRDIVSVPPAPRLLRLVAPGNFSSEVSRPDIQIPRTILSTIDDMVLPSRLEVLFLAFTHAERMNGLEVGHELQDEHTATALRSSARRALWVSVGGGKIIESKVVDWMHHGEKKNVNALEYRSARRSLSDYRHPCAKYPRKSSATSSNSPYAWAKQLISILDVMSCQRRIFPYTMKLRHLTFVCSSPSTLLDTLALLPASKCWNSIHVTVHDTEDGDARWVSLDSTLAQPPFRTLQRFFLTSSTGNMIIPETKLLMPLANTRGILEYC